MRHLLRPLRPAADPHAPHGAPEGGDSVLFSAAFANPDAQGNAPFAPWEARAVEIGARRLPADGVAARLQALWAGNRHMALLDADAVQHMVRFFSLVRVGPQCEVIRQDERGDFMAVLLAGDMSVNRTQPWGECLHLAQLRPGDIMGEMSLLDGGLRHSACTTLADCELAVLDAPAMDEMLVHEPRLAASLAALLARKLSQRLRAVSASLAASQPRPAP
ncbi:MAG: cyclic nucleotide-binding domain-containing protein [Comamonadaceae bacterium]|nr:cyclic nucleotide-binding domain-containing protein [Comamonadaceae bacterium]